MATDVKPKSDDEDDEGGTPASVAYVDDRGSAPMPDVPTGFVGSLAHRTLTATESLKDVLTAPHSFLELIAPMLASFRTCGRRFLAQRTFHA